MNSLLFFILFVNKYYRSFYIHLCLHVRIKLVKALVFFSFNFIRSVLLSLPQTPAELYKWESKMVNEI